MTAMPPSAARPLLDLLGAIWTVPAAATDCAWSVDGTRVGVALADGSLALAEAVWQGAPSARRRGDGGVELVPATAAPPPVALVGAHAGACGSVAADADGGFLTGGADGQAMRVQPRGTAEPLARIAPDVSSLVAAGRGGWRVCAGGGVVRRPGPGGSGIAVPSPVAALALDPTGARLAIGHPDGVTLWSGGDRPVLLAAPGPAHHLAWSPDGAWLAAATEAGLLHVWPMSDIASPLVTAIAGAVGGLAALAPGPAFVVALGGRLLRWRVVGGALAAPESCGVASRSDVTCLACHPQRPLIAAGYANGAAALCQPGSAEMLLLRGAGDGPVAAIAFSPAGEAIALGTTDGRIAVLHVPDILFRPTVDAA
jgi:hypothetical protein